MQRGIAQLGLEDRPVLRGDDGRRGWQHGIEPGLRTAPFHAAGGELHAVYVAAKRETAPGPDDLARLRVLGEEAIGPGKTGFVRLHLPVPVPLLPGELVHIVDITNGARLETYTIAGERGSGVIGINGAAARLVHRGDLVILIAYGQMETAEARELEPKVVFVDADNKIVGTGGDPAEALPGTDLLRGDLTYPGTR